MSLAQQVASYQRESNEKQRQIRDMVLDSYRDVAIGKGRDCNEFFDELEKKYSGAGI